VEVTLDEPDRHALGRSDFVVRTDIDEEEEALSPGEVPGGGSGGGSRGATV
jgi:hypothetical protein